MKWLPEFFFYWYLPFIAMWALYIALTACAPIAPKREANPTPNSGAAVWERVSAAKKAGKR